MQYNQSDYPDASILGQMFLDVYADTETGEITALYDTELTRVLLGLEFYKEEKLLVFEFDGGKLPLGKPLSDEVADYVSKADVMTLMHVDMATKEPMSGMEVPLKVI